MLWSTGGIAKRARTVTGSATLLLEGLQYTGLRSGSPDTRNVYAGTAETPFPASPSSIQGAPFCILSQVVRPCTGMCLCQIQVTTKLC